MFKCRGAGITPRPSDVCALRFYDHEPLLAGPNPRGLAHEHTVAALLQKNLVALRIQRQVVLVGADVQVAYAHTHGLVLVGTTAHGGGVATGVENA